MKKFSKIAIFSWIGFLLLSLSACQTAPKNIPQKNTMAPYKRLIQFVSNHKDLSQTIENLARQDNTLIVKHEDDFSEFRVVLTSKVKRINSLQTKPLLMGRLQKSKTPVHFTVNYKLTNASRHIIAQGNFEEITETSRSIYPKLSLNNHIETKTLKTMAAKILTEVQTYIRPTAWSTTVIGQKDNQHITVFANKEAGLKAGDLFITESQPTAKLQVVMFEETATGQSRAILRLAEGFLPTVGRRLIPSP